MATWKSRFEDITSEIEGKMAPSEIRQAYLNRTLASQLLEELMVLKSAWEAGTIDYDEYMTGLAELEQKLKECREHINKVDFDEDE